MVCAEPLVDERQRRFDVAVDQIGEHRLNLGGRQHALVDEGSSDERARDVEGMPLGELQAIDGVLDPLPDDVQLPLEARLRIIRRFRLAGPDEELLEHRRGRDRGAAEQRVVGGHRPPAEHPLPLVAHHLFDDPANPIARSLPAREKHEAGAVAARAREHKAERRGHLA